MASSFEIVQPATVPTEQFNTCETEVRKLTDPLGCTEMRVNQVIVEPGSVTTPHTHDGQEEVFVATTGGQIVIEGDVRRLNLRIEPTSLALIAVGAASVPISIGRCSSGIATAHSMSGWPSTGPRITIVPTLAHRAYQYQRDVVKKELHNSVAARGRRSPKQLWRCCRAVSVGLQRPDCLVRRCRH
ncbi:hypothetical protein [Haloarcula hispanica]|uniref:hypothetical protein n=1 Tax=Haloarcula hispanica TaxID=51589 RepID=UPI001F5CD754|nr:hypothetical protein [Haloarcula hispanica]